MKYKRKRSLICQVILCLLFMSISMVNVYASENYHPLSVNVEISGKGTYVLESDETDNPMPKDSRLTVNGKGRWTIDYVEPGTYTYSAFNAKKPKEKKDITVFVTNDEDELTEMNASVVFEENGKKTDGKFPVPEKKTKAPDTGDRNNLWINFLVMMISLAAAGAALYRINHVDA